MAERSLSGGLKWTGYEADGVLTEQGMPDWDPQRIHAGLVWEMNVSGGCCGEEGELSLLLSVLCGFPLDLVFPRVLDEWQLWG